ncbi:TetR/AcrR family transcriptional regulator [Tepidicaulis sp.]|uniref:TetR/AcrR family transcriptional regulator n=1 Tax=Tepidicaulis sp. TaxID=1920809 RepID=UPI003B5A9CAF
MPSPKRAQLLETAQSLFAREGFKGTAVDKLVAEAGIAKMTLYKAYGTKEELILETLRRRDAALRAFLVAESAKAGPDPEERVLACFDALETWSGMPGFNGCYFVSALMEYGNPDDKARQLAKDHKRHVLDFVTGLCVEAGFEAPEDRARDLRLLMEGATVAKLTLDQKDSFRRAKEMARLLLSQQTPSAAS